MTNSMAELTELTELRQRSMLKKVGQTRPLLETHGFTLPSEEHLLTLLHSGAFLTSDDGSASNPSLILSRKEGRSAPAVLQLMAEIGICPSHTIPDHHKPVEIPEAYVLLSPTGSLGLIPKVSGVTVSATADQHEEACREALNPEKSAWKNSLFFPDLLTKGSLNPEVPQLSLEELLWTALWEYLFTGCTPTGGFYRAGKQSSTRSDLSLDVWFDGSGVGVGWYSAGSTHAGYGCAPRVVSTPS